MNQMMMHTCIHVPDFEATMDDDLMATLDPLEVKVTMNVRQNTSFTT